MSLANESEDGFIKISGTMSVAEIVGAFLSAWAASGMPEEYDDKCELMFRLLWALLTDDGMEGPPEGYIAKHAKAARKAFEAWRKAKEELHAAAPDTEFGRHIDLAGVKDLNDLN